MPKPIAVCLEDPGARAEAERFLRCVAVPGRRPGLRIDPAGAVTWCSEAPAACELWVSADDKLMLFRPEAAVAVRLRRAGRVLDVPEAKPVVLRTGDEVTVDRRTLRVHLHGEVSSVVAPSPLPAAERPGSLRRAAAVVAIGAAAFAPGCGGSSAGTRAPDPEPADASVAVEPADAAVAPEPEAGEPDIEIRYIPPAPSEDMKLVVPPAEPPAGSREE
ncbi:MAG: hypothetical protein HY907_16125 [Deltaproteobacteria bacterium]|nr:hypothetical protein [Deltaproteobacteria bacterium]